MRPMNKLSNMLCNDNVSLIKRCSEVSRDMALHSQNDSTWLDIE